MTQNLQLGVKRRDNENIADDLLPLLVCDDILAADSYDQSVHLGDCPSMNDATAMDWTFAELLENDEIDI